MTTSTHPRTFGIAGTPKGDVLLYQPLLRIIANFVGPLSDLTLGLTLPFKSELWGLVQRLHGEGIWICPESARGYSRVDVISTLREKKKSREGEMLGVIAHMEDYPRCNDRFCYELWLVLRCPSSYALGSNRKGDRLDTTAFRFVRSEEDTLFFLWALGEGEESLRLKNGEATLREIGARILHRRRRWDIQLYIHGLIGAEDLKMEPSEILDLCQREENRLLAIPFLERGGFHNNEFMNMDDGRDDPHRPYECLIAETSFDAFLFISRHAKLDINLLLKSIRLDWGDDDYMRIVDHILFDEKFMGYKRIIEKMEEKKHEEEARFCHCCACYLQDLIRAIYIHRSKWQEFCSLNLRLRGTFSALRLLVESYMITPAMSRSELFRNLMYYLGSGLKGARRGDNIDNMLFALSAGKKKEFTSGFLSLTAW